MHTVHINPYFIINHIIFINTKKKYVFIDQTAWNTIHRVIFGGRASSLDERKRLKSLFYDMYYGYVYEDKPIDVDHINAEVESIKWKNYEKEVPAREGTTQVYSEVAEPIEGYLEPDRKIENKEVSDIVTRYSKITEENNTKERLTLFLNTMVSTSEEYRMLIDYIGWGRCLSKLNQFISENDFAYYTDLYLVFFDLFLAHGDMSLRFTMINIRYDFVCDSCKRVGSHRSKFVRGLRHYHTCCPWGVKWFDSSGYIELEPFDDHYDVANHLVGRKTLEEKYFNDGKIRCLKFSDYFIIGKHEFRRDSDITIEYAKIDTHRCVLIDQLSTKYDYQLGRKLNPFFSKDNDVSEYNIKCEEFSLYLDSFVEYSSFLNELGVIEDKFHVISDLFKKKRNPVLNVESGFGSYSTGQPRKSTAFDAFNNAFNNRK